MEEDDGGKVMRTQDLVACGSLWWLWQEQFGPQTVLEYREGGVRTYSWQEYIAFKKFCWEAESWMLLLFLFLYSYFPTMTIYWFYHMHIADSTPLIRKREIPSRTRHTFIFCPLQLQAPTSGSLFFTSTNVLSAAVISFLLAFTICKNLECGAKQELWLGLLPFSASVSHSAPPHTCPGSFSYPLTTHPVSFTHQSHSCRQSSFHPSFYFPGW